MTLKCLGAALAKALGRLDRRFWGEGDRDTDGAVDVDDTRLGGDQQRSVMNLFHRRFSYSAMSEHLAREFDHLEELDLG